ncbi:unnamed protein product [Boreogadus saida]
MGGRHYTSHNKEYPQIIHVMHGQKPQAGTLYIIQPRIILGPFNFLPGKRNTHQHTDGFCKPSLRFLIRQRQRHAALLMLRPPLGLARNQRATASLLHPDLLRGKALSVASPKPTIPGPAFLQFCRSRMPDIPTGCR